MGKGPSKGPRWVFAGELFPLEKVVRVDDLPKQTTEDFQRIADYCWLFRKACDRKDACSIRSKSFHKLACKDGVVLQ